MGFQALHLGPRNPAVTPGTLEVSLGSTVGSHRGEQQEAIVGGLDASWQSLQNILVLDFRHVKLPSQLGR